MIIAHPPLFTPLVGSSGYVLESSETGGVGSGVSAAASTFNLGDDAANRQYRAILSFNTSVLPDNAVITGVRLSLTKQSITGTDDPFTLLGGLLVDVRKGYFGPTASIEAKDFQAPASLSGIGPYSPALVLGGYSINLSSSAFSSINKLTTNGGLTQFRLRLRLDDNNNRAPNFITFYSSDSLPRHSPPACHILLHSLREPFKGDGPAPSDSEGSTIPPA